MSRQTDRDHLAARWLIEQHDTEFSDEQRAELAHWLVADIENCIAYLRHVRAWRQLAIMKRGAVPIVYGRRPGEEDRARALLGVTTDPPPALQTADDAGAIFGELVRIVRKGKNWSRETLSREAGVSKRYIDRLESGYVSPTLSRQLQIARGFKLRASDFVVLVERSIG